jgi:hypothetical protein
MPVKPGGASWNPGVSEPSLSRDFLYGRSNVRQAAQDGHCLPRQPSLSWWRAVLAASPWPTLVVESLAGSNRAGTSMMQ